jgi:hypothetical protein
VGITETFVTTTIITGHKEIGGGERRAFGAAYRWRRLGRWTLMQLSSWPIGSFVKYFTLKDAAMH